MTKRRGKLTKAEYSTLKKELDENQLKILKALEDDVNNLKIDYWDIYRSVYRDMEGKSFNSRTIRAYYDAPFTRLKTHLLILAIEVREMELTP